MFTMAGCAAPSSGMNVPLMALFLFFFGLYGRQLLLSRPPAFSLHHGACRVQFVGARGCVWLVSSGELTAEVFSSSSGTKWTRRLFCQQVSFDSVHWGRSFP